MGGIAEIELMLRGEPVFLRMRQQGGGGIPLVMLHGFCGDSRDWIMLADGLAGESDWVAIDLLGHGRSGAPRAVDRYSMSEQVADLEAIFQHLEFRRIHLLGYSMGGRAALAYAIHHPERVAALILESASPGLCTAEERGARRASDEILADRVETLGVAKFIREWEEIPLLSSQKSLPSEILERQREIRRSQKSAGLAGSLRGMGTGAQPSLHMALDRLALPVLLLTGAQDQKFTRIAVAMKNALPRAAHVVVQYAGHNVHLEQPQKFKAAVRTFLAGLW